MSADITRQYKNKIFDKGQIKQFAIKLYKFSKILPTDVYIFLHRTEDGFETSTKYSIEDFENICELDDKINRIAFHTKYDIIQFSFKAYFNAINGMYIIYGDLERAKKVIFLTENALELTQFEQGAELTLVNSQTTEEAKQRSEQTECLNNTDSSLLNVWHTASKQLQLLLSFATYETWIAPIVPSVDGNMLVLNCSNDFGKDWIESRYQKDILEAVKSIEPTVEGIIVRYGDKDTKLTNTTTNKRHFIEIDETLYDLMTMVFEKETKSLSGLTFEKYYYQVIQSYCRERL